jgi:hypothetical protein
MVQWRHTIVKRAAVKPLVLLVPDSIREMVRIASFEELGDRKMTQYAVTRLTDFPKKLYAKFPMRFCLGDLGYGICDDEFKADLFEVLSGPPKGRLLGVWGGVTNEGYGPVVEYTNPDIYRGIVMLIIEAVRGIEFEDPRSHGEFRHFLLGMKRHPNLAHHKLSPAFYKDPPKLGTPDLRIFQSILLLSQLNHYRSTAAIQDVFTNVLDLLRSIVPGLTGSQFYQMLNYLTYMGEHSLIRAIKERKLFYFRVLDQALEGREDLDGCRSHDSEASWAAARSWGSDRPDREGESRAADGVEGADDGGGRGELRGDVPGGAQGPEGGNGPEGGSEGCGRGSVDS